MNKQSSNTRTTSAKLAVMKPVFKMRVDRDKTKYKRKSKHRKSDNG